MGPKALEQVLTALIPARIPIWVWGPPGVGKSAVMRRVARRLRIPLADIRAVLLDPVDLRGIPAVNGDHRAHWCPPSWLPTSGSGILFLDELAQAAPLVQSACLQLCLDRKIGEYTLPDGWVIVAASNRQEDRAGAHRIISPLLNRFCHFDFDTSLDDWQEWAVGGMEEDAETVTLDGTIQVAEAHKAIAVEIRSFLRWKPSLLNDFDPSAGKRSFASQRSWEFVSRLFRLVPDEYRLPVVAGCVGEGVAAEFLAHVQVHSQLPDPASIIANPGSAPVPKETSILYALVGALVEHVRKASGKALDAAVTYAQRLPAEPSVLMMRDLCAVNPKVLTSPAAAGWLKKNRHLILAQQP